METLAIVTDNFDYGGAQKMLAFAINSIAPLFDSIIIILQENTIRYKLPKNTKIITINEYNYNTNNLFSKMKRVMYYSNSVHEILVVEQPTVLLTFGCYYSLIALIAKRWSNIKLVSCERRSPQTLDPLWKLISFLTYKFSDMTIFQLDNARDFYGKNRLCETAVIPNPYICSESVNQFKARDRRKTISMAAARLEYEKGFDIGIQAFKIFNSNHPDYTLEIYGKGDFNLLYADIVGSNTNIKFKGISTNIIRDISDSALFLFPSRSEGIPNMLMEALGAGLPCVAADCIPGGAKLLIGDNERGILVDVEDIIGTAEAMEMIVSNNDLSDFYSKQALGVKELFSKDNIEKKWISSIKGLIDRNEINNKI